ncbi:MAG: DUF1018 domain-containing protein [Chitinivibrionales bacterium]|nr:DUF1018 domain-containing protein [Chitinivibrionales bacterium]
MDLMTQKLHYDGSDEYPAMATVEQIKKIHALKNDLGLEDDVYHSMVQSFRVIPGRPAKMSSELSRDQASELIEQLEQLIEKTPGLYDKIYASSRQLRFIQYLWNRVTRAPDRESKNKALDSFIWRRFHVRNLNRLPKKKASKIIASLRAMEKREHQT